MPIKVLYVEDELFLGKIVKETLETRGFEVIMESDGADVIRSFEDENPDICILDVMLPNKSGFELAEDIRKLNDDVPVIFLTAKTQTEDVVQGLLPEPSNSVFLFLIFISLPSCLGGDFFYYCQILKIVD